MRQCMLLLLLSGHAAGVGDGLMQFNTQASQGGSTAAADASGAALQPRQFSIGSSWTTATDFSKLQAAAKAEAAAATAGKLGSAAAAAKGQQAAGKAAAAAAAVAPAVLTSAAAQLIGLHEVADASCLEIAGEA
jgi:hypothetical protein